MADQGTVGSGAEPLEWRTEAAYTELLTEIAALPDADEVVLNADVMASVTLVLGVLPGLRTLRPDMADQLPRFNLARFDKLEKYALALSHAHALQRSAMDRSQVTELGVEVTSVRDRLHADAMYLAGYKLVDAERLKDCKKANGYRAAATDVFTLVAVLKERWPNVEGKTPMTLEGLSHAGSRALELLAALGEREQAPLDMNAAARLKQKAFSLFVAAYEDTRRAVGYLRADHDDADEIAPSIWGHKVTRRRPEPEPTPPPAPSPPAADAPSAAAPVVAQQPVVMDNSASLPVTSPFTN